MKRKKKEMFERESNNLFLRYHFLRGIREKVTVAFVVHAPLSGQKKNLECWFLVGSRVILSNFFINILIMYLLN